MILIGTQELEIEVWVDILQVTRLCKWYTFRLVRDYLEPLTRVQEKHIWTTCDRIHKNEIDGVRIISKRCEVRSKKEAKMLRSIVNSIKTHSQDEMLLYFSAIKDSQLNNFFVETLRIRQ